MHKIPLKRFHIELIIAFLATFIITAVILATTSDIVFTDALWLFLAFQALVVAGFFFIFRKKHARAGHLPIVIGIYLVILGAGMFIGSLQYSNTNQYGEEISKERLWELNNIQAGIFVVLVIIGIVATIIGLRIAFQNVYFWTWKAFLVIGVVVAVIAILIYSIIPK